MAAFPIIGYRLFVFFIMLTHLVYSLDTYLLKIPFIIPFPAPQFFSGSSKWTIEEIKFDKESWIVESNHFSQVCYLSFWNLFLYLFFFVSPHRENFWKSNFHDLHFFEVTFIMLPISCPCSRKSRITGVYLLFAFIISILHFELHCYLSV